MDGDVFVVVVVAFASYSAEVFVVGKNAGIHLVAVDGATVDFDVVAEVLALACALDGVAGGVGVDGRAVIDKCKGVVGVVGVEFISYMGGLAGVVVDGEEQVVGAVIVEWVVE